MCYVTCVIYAIGNILTELKLDAIIKHMYVYVDSTGGSVSHAAIRVHAGASGHELSFRQMGREILPGYCKHI